MCYLCEGRILIGNFTAGNTRTTEIYISSCLLELSFCVHFLVLNRFSVIEGPLAQVEEQQEYHYCDTPCFFGNEKTRTVPSFPFSVHKWHLFSHNNLITQLFQVFIIKVSVETTKVQAEEPKYMTF